MFKKDEYIVINTYSSSSKSFKRNYIYKIRETFDYIRVYKDSHGSKNGWSVIPFHNKEIWRYATPKEIRLYDEKDFPVLVDFDHPLEEFVDLDKIKSLILEFENL